MSLSSKTEEEISQLLRNIVREKLRTYQPETEHMPFHHRLLGKDRYAMFSFIQSMNTTFGVSIWEQCPVVPVSYCDFVILDKRWIAFLKNYNFLLSHSDIANVFAWNKESLTQFLQKL